MRDLMRHICATHARPCATRRNLGFLYRIKINARPDARPMRPHKARPCATFVSHCFCYARLCATLWLHTPIPLEAYASLRLRKPLSKTPSLVDQSNRNSGLGDCRVNVAPPSTLSCIARYWGSVMSSLATIGHLLPKSWPACAARPWNVARQNPGALLSPCGAPGPYPNRSGFPVPRFHQHGPTASRAIARAMPQSKARYRSNWIGDQLTARSTQP